MDTPGTKLDRQIVLQMAALRNVLPVVGKNQKNAHQGWNFRGIDDALNVIGVALEKAGVVLTCQHKLLSFEPNEGGKGFTAVVEVQGVFTSTTDGSSMVQSYIGQGTDPSDKAISKATSMAFKYLLFQGLQIPTTGVLDDADTDNFAATPKARPRNSRA